MDVSSEFVHATEVFLLDREKGVMILGKKKPRMCEPFPHAIMGVGGKLEPYENLEECARRETREEFGVMLGELSSIGTMKTFRRRRGLGQWFMVHLFVATAWYGEPSESNEVVPVTVPLHGPYPEAVPEEVRIILRAIANGEQQLMRISVVDMEDGTTHIESRLEP